VWPARWRRGPAVAFIGLALVITVALASAAGTRAATSQPAIPDPLAAGPQAVTKVEYYGGSIMMSAPNINGTATAAFVQPLDGALFYPSGPGPFPLVVLLHGNHADCLNPATGQESSPQPCAPPNVPILNYEGYDYIGQNLASHGYVVISLDADALTSYQTSQDNGVLLRTQLIAASLDMAYAWADGAPLYVQTSPGQVESSPPPARSPYALAGKLNLENGVGLFGHSRGGEGVAEFPAFNRIRPAPGKKYKIDAVEAFAPVDYERDAVFGTATTDVPNSTNNSVPGFTAFASVLPLCDGDVSDLHGARTFMNSLHAEPGDPSPKIQFAFQGGDHDYTNTVWASSGSEDGNTYSANAARPDAACGEDIPGNVRLTPVDQQKLSLALTAAFMRRYVGGETAFDPLMTGEAGLPASACPTARGVDCSQELKTTYFAGADQRRDVIVPDPNTPLTADALGGKLTATGFQNPYQSQYCVGSSCETAGVTPVPPTTAQGIDWCDPEPVEFRVTSGFPTATKPCPLPPAGTAGQYDPVAFGGQANERENDPVNRSFGPQLAVAWNGPAQLDAEIPSSSGGESGFKVLAMDAAVNYFDSRNPPSGPDNPAAETNPRAAIQHFGVRLTDRSGHSATVDAGNPAYGTALEPSLGSARRHVLLNEIRIPLTDFRGVDLTHVAKLSLIFGGLTPSGSIELANVRFQEAVNPPATDPVIGPASAPTTSTGLPAVDAIALNGTNKLPDPKLCTDRTPPRTRLSGLRLSNGQLIVTGTAADIGCRGSHGQRSVRGKILRVQVSLARLLHGSSCRYLGSAGVFAKRSQCKQQIGLVAKGTARFRLLVAAHIPAGLYRVLLQGIDAAGNLERPHGYAIRVVHGARGYSIRLLGALEVAS
jgi:dienelactone hydrolase